MRTTLLATILIALATAGCTSVSASRQTTASASGQSKERVVVDTDKMAAVDRAARETGIAVHWINPPVKRVR